MYTLNKSAAAVMDALTATLAQGQSRKIDNANGTYMAVHVECIGRRLFSIAHYFIQNGDMCQDPEVVFNHAETGAWLPLTFQQAIPPIYRVAVELGDDGRPTRWNEGQLRDLVSFCDTWMANIADQQGGIDAIRAAAGARQGG